MILAGVILGLGLLLLGLTRPAAGVGVLAAADLIIMEGLPVGGGTVAVESLFLLYLAAVPLLRWLVDGESLLPSPGSQRPLLIFVLLFAVSATASTLAGGLPTEGVQVLLRLPLWALFAAVPATLLRRDQDIRIAAACIIAAALLLLAWSLAQGIPETEDQGGPWRVGYKNPLGHSLALGALLAYCVSLGSKNRLPALAAAIVLSAGTAYTQSRGGMAAGLAGFAVCWWMAAEGTAKRGAQLACLAAAPIAVLALATGIFAQTFESIVNQDSSSNLYRFQIAVLAVRLFVANPLLGVGLGNLESSTGSQAIGLRSLATKIISGDNDYARILAELGALGVAVLGMALWAFRGHLASASRSDRETRGRPSFTRIMGAGVASFLTVLGLFESTLFSPTGWFFVGFAWACIGAKSCAFSR